MKSADGGVTWQPIHVGGALSELTVNSIQSPSGAVTPFATELVIDPDIPNTWYLQTGLSVYRSSDAGLNWFPLAIGVPLVNGATSEVGQQGFQLHRASRTLWAATTGRGVWELAIPVAAPRISAISPQSIAFGTPLDLTVSGANFDSTSIIQVNGRNAVTGPHRPGRRGTVPSPVTGAPKTAGAALTAANRVE